MKTLLERPRWLRANFTSEVTAVDRLKNIISGVIIAEEGPFKTEGRGEFDGQSLRTIVKLMREKPNGLKSRFAHPTLSDDGIGSFLGRFRDPKRDKVLRPADKDSAGEKTFKEIELVRADLHLDPTSFETPKGNLGKYVLDLAESDSEAFATSLVLQVEEEVRLDAKGRRLQDEKGIDLPPLWRPTVLHGSDVVDTGDATNAFLDAGQLSDHIVRQGAEILDVQFAGQTREVVEARCFSWLKRYLDLRYGVREEEPEDLIVESAEIRRRLIIQSRSLLMGANLTHDSAVADSEPNWDGVDKAKLPRVAFAERGEPDKKSTWAYPHHWVSGGRDMDKNGIWTSGTLYLHRGGLDAAWAAANGARSGKKARPEVVAHLQAHRRALGLDKENSFIPEWSETLDRKEV